jgi:chemotaxis protein histidine kinase CheA
MPQADLLEMLAAETNRRAVAIIGGVEELAHSGASDPAKVEALRGEAHGLKGAASVVGQSRLAELAERIEVIFTERRDEGTIDIESAARLVAATSALHEGAEAAAERTTEPPAVGEALLSLSD